MQKNEIVKVKIEDIGVGGEGIGKVDGYTLFIKDAIIGDVVEAKVMKAKKNYGYARLMNVLTPSKDRVEEPVCPMARKCGGCQIQEMKYPAQLAFKEARYAAIWSGSEKFRQNFWLRSCIRLSAWTEKECSRSATGIRRSSRSEQIKTAE